MSETMDRITEKKMRLENARECLRGFLRSPDGQDVIELIAYSNAVGELPGKDTHDTYMQIGKLQILNYLTAVGNSNG